MVFLAFLSVLALIGLLGAQTDWQWFAYPHHIPAGDKTLDFIFAGITVILLIFTVLGWRKR